MGEMPNLFPALDEATEAALRESIRRFGVLVPVVRDQYGRTLDGFHRSRIAAEEGVKFRVDVVTVRDDDEAREIAATLNTDRRHLTPEQVRQQVPVLRAAGHSQGATAKALGVTQGRVSQIEKELISANEFEPPAEAVGIDGVRRRRPTIVAAKNEQEAEKAQAALMGTELPDVPVLDVKRVERLAREQQADRSRAQPVAAIVSVAGVEIRHGDLRTALADLHGTVDAIITDPPYPAEFIPEFDALGKLAVDLLKPDGLLVAMVGQAHLPAYLSELGKHLIYRWCGAYLTDGPATRIHGRAVGTKWKPLLIYGGERFITQDVFASRADDKRHHHWGQSESGIADIVERLTNPGDLVVDPFLGGGTTAVVCQALGRRFVGCDIDAVAVAAARARLAA